MITNLSSVKITDDIIVLDVRDADEVKRSGIVEGAVHIPLAVLPLKTNELDKNKTVYVYCAAGGRAGMAAQLLERDGFTAYNTGGFTDWTYSGHKSVDI
jgi:rhodanese-related sulfurtransferase